MFYPADPSQPMIIRAKHRNCTIDVANVYYLLNTTSQAAVDSTTIWFYGYDWDGKTHHRQDRGLTQGLTG